MKNTQNTLAKLIECYLSTGNRLEYGNIATLERSSDMQLEIMVYYTDEDGRALMYFVRECYSHFYLSYIARHGKLQWFWNMPLLMKQLIR